MHRNLARQSTIPVVRREHRKPRAQRICHASSIEFHEALLRGPSPFSEAERELIAAYVWRKRTANGAQRDADGAEPSDDTLSSVNAAAGEHMMFNGLYIMMYVSAINPGETSLITAAQLRAARALLGIDQRTLAHAARLSLPTIQRMEASEGVIRGTVDSLVNLISAIEAAGVELIAEGETSADGGRGVRLRATASLPRARSSARLRPPGSGGHGLVAARRRPG